MNQARKDFRETNIIQSMKGQASMRKKKFKTSKDGVEWWLGGKICCSGWESGFSSQHLHYGPNHP